MSAATTSAVDTLVKTLDTAGVLAKMRRLNLFAADQLTGALVPVVNTLGSTTDSGVNLVSGDYSLTTGVQGNGTSKYIETGLDLNTISANGTDLHISRTCSPGNATMGVGKDSPSTSFYCWVSVNYDWYWGATASNRVPPATAEHVIITRESGAAIMYAGGASVSTIASPTGAAPPPYTFTLMGLKRNGGMDATYYTNNQVTAYSIGTGLSAANATAYRNAMTAFNAAIGRSAV